MFTESERISEEKIWVQGKAKNKHPTHCKWPAPSAAYLAAWSLLCLLREVPRDGSWLRDVRGEEKQATYIASLLPRPGLFALAMFFRLVAKMWFRK